MTKRHTENPLGVDRETWLDLALAVEQGYEGALQEALAHLPGERRVFDDWRCADGAWRLFGMHFSGGCPGILASVSGLRWSAAPAQGVRRRDECTCMLDGILQARAVILGTGGR